MSTSSDVLSEIKAARQSVPATVKALKRYWEVSDGAMALAFGTTRQTINGRMNGVTKLTAEDMAGFARFFGVPVGVLYLDAREAIRWCLDHPESGPLQSGSDQGEPQLRCSSLSPGHYLLTDAGLARAS